MASRRSRTVLIVAMTCGLAGCVERRYTIRTNPPGALAIVNGEEIGATPVSRSYTYYGPREITLIADGYQTQTLIQPVQRPWFDNYLTEFFTENLVPWTLRDEREFVYQMQPGTATPPEELDARAQSLRQTGQAPLPARSRGLRALLGL